MDQDRAAQDIADLEKQLGALEKQVNDLEELAEELKEELDGSADRIRTLESAMVDAAQALKEVATDLINA